MKFIELLKKYKVYILTVLLVIFFIRSCSKSTQVRKGSDEIIGNKMVIDSLENVIKDQKSTINAFPEVLRQEKIKVHSGYDDYISKKDRGKQLMELHMIIKDNIKALENEK